MVRETYFVSVDNQRIESEMYDEGTHYFKIKADQDELFKIEYLLRELSRQNFSSKAAFVNPFKEEVRIEKKQEHNEILQELYQEVYKLGTEQTREKIEELGILDEDLTRTPYS